MVTFAESFWRECLRTNVQTCTVIYTWVCMNIETTYLPVAVIVRLVPSKNTEIVVDFVITRTIVMIKAAAICCVVGHDEIMMDVIEGRYGAWGVAVCYCGEVWKSIPAIEGTLVFKSGSGPGSGPGSMSTNVIAPWS